MGFFKDLNDVTVEINDESADTEAQDDLISVSADTEADEEAENVDESLLANLFDEGTADTEVQLEDNYDIGTDEEPVETVVQEPVRPQVSREGSDEEQVTVITKGTTINGSIISDCSLNVMGTINGDIECIGKLTISGNVVGNSIASDVYINSKRLNGNIDSEGTVKIGLGTVVVGDIKAGSAVIAGAVKGELDIKGPVIFDSTAIIKGNVKAKSVQMNNGAVLEGFCSLSYAAVDIDDIFE